MPSANIEMLQVVAKGLGTLKEDVVFVGGSVAELYASNPELSDIRPTLDVDCVIELHSRAAFAKLEDNLRALEFTNDTSNGAPICRWIYQGIMVDVMPTNADFLGFSNLWYAEGIENRVVKTLPNGTEIFVFPSIYYLATKLEAHKGRGGRDLRQSHDFEDIIYILENCSNILADVTNAGDKLKGYLKDEFVELLTNDGLTEGIESALPYGSESAVTKIIMGLMQNIADIK
jgi:predicted nucleotidyltransferase